MRVSFRVYGKMWKEDLTQTGGMMVLNLDLLIFVEARF